MKNTTLIAMGLVVLAGYGVGCGKAEKPELKAATTTEEENWEPEAVTLPEGHTADDGHDHSGDAPGGHSH